MPAEPIPAELAAFLHGEIDARTFRHADHVRMAFEILQRHDFSETLSAYSRALKTMARRAGKPEAYHETITVAFLSLIAERSAVGRQSDFTVFARDNPDLYEKSVLERWYAPERLRSDAARRTFVLPQPRDADR